MRASFPLFQSHLDLAHRYWSKLLQPGDTAIDATCGNGHDALFLCQLLLKDEKKGRVFLIDKQPEALRNTHERLLSHFESHALNEVVLLQQCHSRFPETLCFHSVKLIVYNLGYLPGGDKQATTSSSTTLESLKAAAALIVAGGAISVTCYPGHPAGKVEEQAVLDYAASLPPAEWSCCHHRWTNRKEAPSLLLICKRD